jgi:integrase
MARLSKPWYRKSLDAWYVQLDRKQVFLAKGELNKDAAEAALERLLKERDAPAAAPAADPLPPAPSTTIAKLLASYLVYAERRLKPKTFADYKKCLEQFAEEVGVEDPTNPKPIENPADLKPFHVDDWIRKHNWNATTERIYKSTVFTLFNWAHRQGHLAANPLANLEKPPIVSRGLDRLIGDEEHQRMLDKAAPTLRDLLIALRLTGARPSEIAKITAANFDAAQGVAVLTDHKTSKKGYHRIILLPPPVVEICKRLATIHPTGPLFRNNAGTPWTPICLVNAMRRLRKRAQVREGVIAYGYRHTFATDALAKGVPDAHVAALLGHSGTQMLHRHYGHLTAQLPALRQALEKISEPSKPEAALTK